MSEWVYQYDKKGNRIGLVEIPDSHIIPLPRPRDPNLFNDVWFWGNPLKKKSYMFYLKAATYGLLSLITSQEFARTYPAWLKKQIKIDTDADEIAKAIKLRNDAKTLGIKKVQEYVAQNLGCSQQRISDLFLLIRIEEVEAEYDYNWYESQTSYSINEYGFNDWYPSKKEIEAKAASIPRICAIGYEGCRGHTQNGKLAYCFPCHSRISADKGLIPEWAIEEENRIRREHYNQAITACIEDHYGTVSLDEADSYLDAA